MATDMSNLAQMMLDWEQLQRHADELRTAIANAVLQIGKTQTVGNVKAVYNKGRKSYDYRAAAGGHIMVTEATVNLFTTTPAPRTDWRKICEHVGISKDEIPYTQSEPSVTVKLV